MQEKTFKYDRCIKNETVVSAIYLKYSGGIDICIEREDDYIVIKLNGSSLLLIEAIKDLMANVCYVVDFS